MAKKQKKSVELVRERLIREGLVGKAVALAGGDLVARMLTEKEREQLQGTDTWQLMEDLFFAQIRWLFEGPHSLACLGNNVPSRLFLAMIDDGVVSVELADGSVASVCMTGAVPTIGNGKTLAELIESGEPFTVEIARTGLVTMRMCFPKMG